MHAAVDDDFAAVLADVAQLAGPVAAAAKLRAKFGEFDREFGLQERMAEAPDGLVRCKAIKPFGPGIPKLDRAVQRPREHRLIGQRDETGQTFGGLTFAQKCDFALHYTRP
ncbi:MAG: hypothetical protein WA837_04265 [Xanthobacteraceae bacterium]